ncbi:TetR family transcriptional regulator [Curtobacterium luteum]|uniref:TetR family transcriptional regulator n=1 Tax=Curtobacterium luteum TaxID=33881 RepID=A0A8H9GA82_9MICO|nr:TetR/AcrR family transcriptional regulator [Curtobacterium luteum]GGK97459.1 TetR family transcriptional regulator [Curtobacterium luteum]
MTTPTLTPARPATPTEHTAVEAADALFTEHGIVPVAMEDVARRAGVSLDELVAVYPTRHDLVVAVLQRWHGAWNAALDRIAAESDDPRDEVLGVFGYLEQCFAEDDWRGCAFINHHAELGRQDPAIAELSREHFRQVEQHLTQVCSRAGLPAHVAQAILLLVEGARVDSAVQRSAQPARTARLAAAMLMSVYEADRSA